MVPQETNRSVNCVNDVAAGRDFLFKQSGRANAKYIDDEERRGPEEENVGPMPFRFGVVGPCLGLFAGRFAHAGSVNHEEEVYRRKRSEQRGQPLMKR